MQVLIEVMAAIVVWAATLVFSQFGIDIDLARPAPSQESRTIERSPKTQPRPSGKAAEDDCPETKAAAIHRI